MRSAGKPVSAGEVATLSGLDRKEVDKAFAQLKKDGAIVSPVRCKGSLPSNIGLSEKREEVKLTSLFCNFKFRVKFEFSYQC